MAGIDLGRISAPILLIVGGDDYQVLELNRGHLRLSGFRLKNWR